MSSVQSIDQGSGPDRSGVNPRGETTMRILLRAGAVALAS